MYFRFQILSVFKLLNLNSQNFSYLLCAGIYHFHEMESPKACTGYFTPSSKDSGVLEFPPLSSSHPNSNCRQEFKRFQDFSLFKPPSIDFPLENSLQLNADILELKTQVGGSPRTHKFSLQRQKPFMPETIPLQVLSDNSTQKMEKHKYRKTKFSVTRNMSFVTQYIPSEI